MRVGDSKATETYVETRNGSKIEERVLNRGLVLG